MKKPSGLLASVPQTDPAEVSPSLDHTAGSEGGGGRVGYGKTPLSQSNRDARGQGPQPAQPQPERKSFRSKHEAAGGSEPVEK